MINLIEIFKDFKGLSFIGLTTETVVKLKGGKSNPFQGRVVKRSRIGGMVYKTDNTNTYLNQVKKEIPDFQLSARKWGERVNNLPIIQHKGAQYLELIIQTAKAEYLLDGEVVERDTIEGLEPSKKGAHSVIVRDYKAESIRELRINGQEYRA